MGVQVKEISQQSFPAFPAQYVSPTQRWRPFIYFLPYLVLGCLYVWWQTTYSFFGDEARYVKYSYNLLNGYYSPPAPDVFLMSGPGYPILMMPFAALNLPFIWWKMLNPVLFYLAAVYFFRTLRIYMEAQPAYWGTFVLFTITLYHHKSELIWVYSESLTILLGVLFTYWMARTFHGNNPTWKALLLPGLVLGLFALTKIVFGPIVFVATALALGLFLLFRRRIFLQLAMVAGVSMLCTLPYLAYTYGLTGKVFYWTNWGGDAIYWMTVPYDNEWGSWQNFNWNHPSMIANHGPMIEKLAPLNGVAWDEAIKTEAMNNLREHPRYFFRNWLANVERILFNFPFSHKPQKLVFLFLPNIFIVVLSTLMLYPTIRYFRQIPPELLAVMAMWLMYMGVNSLVSADIRQFYVVNGMLGAWLVFMLVHFMRIGIRPATA